MDAAPELGMWIDGGLDRSTPRLDVVSPITEETIARAPLCDEATLDRAVRAARDALPSWSADAEARRSLLREAAEALRGETPKLGLRFGQILGSAL